MSNLGLSAIKIAAALDSMDVLFKRSFQRMVLNFSEVVIGSLSSPLLETDERQLLEFVVLLLLVFTVRFVFSVLIFAVTSRLDQSGCQHSVILPLWPSYKHSPYGHPSSLRSSSTSSLP